MSLRSLPLLLLAALLALLQAPTETAASRLQCGVCEALVDEVNAGIAETTLKHSVQTRFRVDEKKRIPYARTEHNLIEILEGSGFSKRFDKYAVVKPHTKSASAMRQAYADAAAGIAPQPVPEPEPVAAEPAATEEPVYTTGDAADAAAAATPAAPSKPVKRVAYTPPAGGVLPLALEHHHAHLVPVETLRSTSVLFEQGGETATEIRDTVTSFVEQHLDEVVLLFHKDAQNIKQKLCGEITEACKPGRHKKLTQAEKKKKEQQQKKKKQQQQEAAAKKKAEAAAAAATAAAATAAAAAPPAEPVAAEAVVEQKDEL